MANVNIAIILEWFEPRISEHGGKLVNEMIKTMKELRKHAKKKRSHQNVLCVMGIICCTFVCF
jgi:hypothetical protein